MPIKVFFFRNKDLIYMHCSLVLRPRVKVNYYDFYKIPGNRVHWVELDKEK